LVDGSASQNLNLITVSVKNAGKSKKSLIHTQLSFYLYRGVFQALIDKHFPVSNSKERFDYGSDFPKTTSQVGRKRKGGNFGKSRGEKRFRKEDMFGHGGCKYGMMSKLYFIFLLDISSKLFFLEVHACSKADPLLIQCYLRNKPQQN
jgi:hypothetical protein